MYDHGFNLCPLPMPTDGMIDLPAAHVPRPGKVEVDIAVDVSEFERGMREVGDAFAVLGDILAERWAHVGETILEAFAPVYAITPGGSWSARIGDPIRTEADALEAIEFAEAVDLWPGKRATKAWRAHAKARYLECKRALPRERHGTLARVRVNKFGAT